MEENNDTQDVDLENNESDLETEDTTEEGSEDLEAQLKEAQAEAAKWKRIASKKDKKPEVESKETKESKPDNKPNELDFGQRAFLKSYGVAGSDELALVKQFQDRGFALDSIVEDDVFLAKLGALREARASANAIPKGQKRSSQTAITDLDSAYAKFEETGELPSDFETRSKVIDKIVEKEKAPFTKA